MPHRRSTRFLSNYATGTIVSGPNPDGTFHLIFRADTISVEAETTVCKSGATYTMRIKANFGTGTLRGRCDPTNVLERVYRARQQN